jgi:mevalonate kinase
MHVTSVKGIGTAKGKVILLGEHAVVHGSPALALAIDRGVRVTGEKVSGPLTLSVPGKQNRIAAGDGSMEGRALAALADEIGIPCNGAQLVAEVAIPTRAGLGSSAALAAACTRALVSLFDVDISDVRLFEAVQSSERVFHGTPSGLDATVALNGGILAFSREHGMRKITASPPPLLVVNSKECGDTKTTVAHFAERLTATGDEGTRRLSRISQLVAQGIHALERADLETLGTAMNENQAHLSWFGVSTARLDGIIEMALRTGALGAKLTGGGGGGCAVVLTKPGDSKVSQTLAEAGFEVMAI